MKNYYSQEYDFYQEVNVEELACQPCSDITGSFDELDLSERRSNPMAIALSELDNSERSTGSGSSYGSSPSSPLSEMPAPKAPDDSKVASSRRQRRKGRKQQNRYYPPSLVHGQPREVCRFYLSKKGCRKGFSCPYEHPVVNLPH